MHFYRKGNAAFDNRDKVVNYIVSLESMFVMPGEHPSNTLPKRVIDVMGVSEEYRSDVRRLMEDAYHHRGEILHLGVAVSESQSVSLVRWVLWTEDYLASCFVILANQSVKH